MSAAMDFYFEFASPYGYFASKKIDALAAKYGRDVVWRPIMLGAVFKVTGARPLGQIPMRTEYFHRDLPRSATYYDVPFVQPEKVPMNSLAASRAFYWLDENDADLAKRLARAVYDAHWGEGRDLSPPEAVAAVAAPLGVDADALLAGIQDPAIKAKLKDATDASIARGVFGSPYIIVDDEPFWGADRLDHVEHWLATGGW